MFNRNLHADKNIHMQPVIVKQVVELWLFSKVICGKYPNAKQWKILLIWLCKTIKLAYLSQNVKPEPENKDMGDRV